MRSVFWFRQDLRIQDNPGLIEAAKNGKVLPIYILDDENPGGYKIGNASRWWLHHSLKSLSESLGGKLAFFVGNPIEVFQKIIRSENIQEIYWNRCYEPWRIQRDSKIKEVLKKEGINVKSFNASLLWEPLEIYKKDGNPFKVFTPFYKKGCLSCESPRLPLLKAKEICFLETSIGLSLNTLDLISNIHWGEKFKDYWKIGEEGAHQSLKIFLKKGLAFYKGGRDFPSRPYTSRLSPHLHFGEISPHLIWQAIKGGNENHLHFQNELGWREFSYYLLYHFPTLPNENFQKKYDHFQWKKSPEHLRCWKKGKTGIPFVDAAMRELWETGYMHNRMRMVVGSFLVKNLLIHWHEGESWFWDCLFDADLANNSSGWQWIAGCGSDAAPYFRIFNPVTQAEKFDPEGTYIHQFLPELRNISPPYLFAPWTAPKEFLEKAGVELGKTYPFPIVDIKKSREDALLAFRNLKTSSNLTSG